MREETISVLHYCSEHGIRVREEKGLMVMVATLFCSTCGSRLSLIKEKTAEPASWEIGKRQILEGERKDRKRRGL